MNFSGMAPRPVMISRTAFIFFALEEPRPSKRRCSVLSPMHTYMLLMRVAEQARLPLQACSVETLLRSLSQPCASQLPSSALMSLVWGLECGKV